MTIKEKIQNAKTYLGIEFGSTRIKAVLIDDTFAPIASGSHEWQNRYENGVWTYSIDDITTGLQQCYAALTEDIRQKFGVTPTTYGAMGISGMMHGYMAFDKDDNLLVPFRTWRNTITEQAASELSELLSFNIPQRWSIAHLYQARQAYRSYQYACRLYSLPSYRKATGRHRRSVRHLPCGPHRLQHRLHQKG